MSDVTGYTKAGADALLAALAPRAGRVFVDSYGGDPTGTTDSTSAFNAALAALPLHPVTGYPWGAVEFSAGSYRVNSPLNNIGPSCYVKGQGIRATTINFYGTGDCFRIYSSWFISEAFNAPVETNYAGGGVLALTVDGTNAGAASSGVHFGDGIEHQIDVCIRHFNQSNSIGLWIDNTITWTEKARVYAYLIDNTTNCKATVSFGASTVVAAASNGVALPASSITVTAPAGDVLPRQVGTGGPKMQVYIGGSQVVQYTGFTNNGDGTVTLTGCTGGTGTLTTGETVQFGSGGASMGYNDLYLNIAANANQDGLAVVNGPNLYGGQITIRGNFTTSPSAVSNAVLRLTGACPTGTRLAGTKTFIQFCHLDVQVEQSGADANKPQTLFLDTGNPIQASYGVMRFGGSGWTLCNVTQLTGRMQFLGPIVGDTNLNPAGTANQVHVSGALVNSQGNADPVAGLSVADGDFFDLVLNQNSTLVVAGSGLAGPQRKTVRVRQNGTGGWTLTWPHNATPTITAPTVKWAGGTAPTVTATSNAQDVFELHTLDGATWYGRVIAQNAS